MPGTKFYHFGHNGSFYCPATLDEAISLITEEGFIWFNFYKPTREELNALIDPVGLHPLSVEDCFDEQQLPKIEHFQKNSFMIFNSFLIENGELFVDEVDFVIGEKYLITVSGYKSGNREPLNNVALMVERAKSSLRDRPDSLLHLVLDYLVDEKYKTFDILEDELDNAEELLLNNFADFNPGKLLELRKDLMRLRKGLFHEREILIKIIRMDCPFVMKKTIVQFRDVSDHLEKIYELTETYREIETSLMELYSSLLNNMMTKMSNETNASVRRLTMIATIFMPLTLIASIFGMSEWSMITNPDNWKISYPLFFLAMGVIALINYLLIRRLEKKNE